MKQTWARDYYQRVRPLLGEAFFEARVALWGLDLGYLAAEALARTGVTRQRWFDDGPAAGAFCRSLGQGWAGQPRAEALAAYCARHNHLQRGWELERSPPDVAELRRHLRSERQRPRLLLARGDRQAGAVARAALDAGVPLVMTFAPARLAVGCVQVVWHPASAADPGRIIAACEGLAAAAPRDLDAPAAHVDGLEARSQALALADWLLTRDSQPRPDLELPLLEQGRFLVLRGTAGWPWDSAFMDDPAPLMVGGRLPYEPPPGLLRGGRLLVLGLGTASLLCAEAGLLFPQQLLLDYKPVSPYNPVRQVYGSRRVGQPKPRALAQILARRLEPQTDWEQTGGGAAASYLQGQRHRLGWADLRLSERDPGSLQRFAALLDEFQPTLAVVGMGRSRDHNFTATAELRRRGIPHLTPTAFPAVTHFKHILTDGQRGPCYDCLQGHLPLDGGPGPTLSGPARELFYGGTQPATLARTLPSAHSLLRLARDLALPPAARPPYLLRELAAERNCFVGANRAERSDSGWLYGVDRPFAMVSFGVQDLVGAAARRRCSCGRLNVV